MGDGGVSCAGSNTVGQLGRDYLPKVNEHPEFEVAPKPVVRPEAVVLSGIAKIQAGADSVCALHTDGTLFCWGNSQYGKGAGSGFPIPNLTPIPYASPTSVN
jgi:alpha-tubulin suppressor-like RCC1 family protein